MRDAVQCKDDDEKVERWTSVLDCLLLLHAGCDEMEHGATAGAREALRRFLVESCIDENHVLAVRTQALEWMVQTLTRQQDGSSAVVIERPPTPPPAVPDTSAVVADDKGVASTDQDTLERVTLALLMRGHQLVNQGQAADAERLYNQVVGHALADRVPRATVAFAHVGLGTIEVQRRKWLNAAQHFARAIKVDPTNAEGHKRLGQLHLASNNVGSAFPLLERYVALSNESPAALYELAQLHMKRRDYVKAEALVRRAVTHASFAEQDDEQRRGQLDLLGLTLISLGSPNEALEQFDAALKIAGSERSVTLVGKAEAQRELGDWAGARASLIAATSSSPVHPEAHRRLGFLSYAGGDLPQAVQSLTVALRVSPDDAEVLARRGIAALGACSFVAATTDFRTLLTADATTPYAFNWLAARAVMQAAAVSPASFSLDDALDPVTKEAWCKRKSCPDRRPPSDADLALARRLEKQQVPKHWRAMARAVYPTADRLGSLLQYQVPGFLSNRRQHRQFGLAMIEAASLVRAGRIDGWRSLFSVAVRWRQLSELNDPVFWVDKLPPASFAAGFGSHTPMYTGQTKVVRYGGFLDRALTAVRTGLVRDGRCTAAEAAGAASPQALLDLVGEDFWTATYVMCGDDEPLEGTRITIQRDGGRTSAIPSDGLPPPDHLDVSIRTAGTPDRLARYSRKLDRAFAAVLAALSADTSVVEPALELVFYWYNAMPLSRGTAACGLVVLYALLLADKGHCVVKPIPRDMQVDWEAILEPNPDVFVSKMNEWLTDARATGPTAAAHQALLTKVEPYVKEHGSLAPTVLEAVRACSLDE